MKTVRMKAHAIEWGTNFQNQSEELMAGMEYSQRKKWNTWMLNRTCSKRFGRMGTFAEYSISETRGRQPMSYGEVKIDRGFRLDMDWATEPSRFVLLQMLYRQEVWKREFSCRASDALLYASRLGLESFATVRRRENKKIA